MIKIYETNSIYVRQLESSDIYRDGENDYTKNFMDQEISKYNSHGLFPISFDDKEELADKIINRNAIVWAICLQDDTHIGNVCLQGIDWINRSAELAIIIWDREEWGKGYGLTVCHWMVYHGFSKMNLHRIWGGTAKSNIGMQLIFTRLKMFQEGEFKDGIFLNGAYENVLQYCLLY